MTRFGMVVDMARCTGCQTCVVACQLGNALRPGMAWLAVDALEWGRWPDADRAFLPHGCLHCDEPACVKVCPTGASAKRDDGIVTVAHDRCIGCSVCVTACPYGARAVNAGTGWHFGAAEPAPYETGSEDRVGVAEKCTWCAERLDAGGRPRCVEACPVGARAFGDLDDPRDAVHAFVAESGAERVAGTGMLYATGGREFDVGDAVRTRFYRPATATEDEANGGTAPEGNPAVLVGAGAVAAAMAAGAGLAAKRNRDRRAGRAQSLRE